LDVLDIIYHIGSDFIFLSLFPLVLGFLILHDMLAHGFGRYRLFLIEK